MMPQEKEQLLSLLDQKARWCSNAEAIDAEGNAVRYDDDAAVAWDITGALCRLFGWQRASVLFEQFDRHIHGKRRPHAWPARNTDINAMAALQNFNDQDDTTFDALRGYIETMPVWHGVERPHKTDAIM